MNLNEQQLSAVLCEDRRILCLAGAGTGKTSCMLARISYLVNKGVDPSSILVLTFTNAAAFEMKNRYKRDAESLYIPEFRTFHSFCYLVLTTNESVRRKLGYFQVPTIADPAIRKRIIQEAGTITNIKSSLNYLENKKNLTSKERYDYEILKKTEIKLMKTRNTITFDQLCRGICELFTSNSEVVQCYKNQYKYIFVDEFQDTDPVQYNFVKSFENSNIFVVGDALQAIYGFRGADSSIIKKLSEDDTWTTIKLFQNYRSTKPICEFANSNSKYAKDSFRVAITSDRNGDDVCCRRSDSYVGYGSVEPDSLNYCVHDIMMHTGSTAIICRTNKEVRAVQDKLEQSNIVYRSGRRNIDVTNVLRSVGDNEYLVDWLSSYLNSDRYADYIRVSTLENSGITKYSVLNFLRDFGTTSTIAERWNLIKCIRRICKENHRPILDRCKDILSILECEYLDLDPLRCKTMKDSIMYIQELVSNNEDVPGSDIYVGTIHSVKGLEFDNVYVMGVNSPNFILNKEDNMNLYYVAITRAKNYLTVFVKDDYFFSDDFGE